MTPVSKIGKSLRTWSTLKGPALEIDVDIVPFDRDRVGRNRGHRRQRVRPAGLKVEPGTVLRTLDLEAPQLALAERVVLVRADVVEGVEVPIFGVGEADHRAVDFDL